MYKKIAILVFVFFCFQKNSHATTTLWLIHNSPDTVLRSVNISLDNTTSIQFRQQKTVLLDSNFVGNITITSTIDPSISYSQPLNLDSNSSYIILIQGVATSGYASHPNGASTGVQVQVIDAAMLPVATAGTSSLVFVHGGTDFPTCDLTQFPGALVEDNIQYGDYRSFVRDTLGYNFNLTTVDSSLLLATFRANLKNFSAKRVLLVLSGFLSPVNNKNGRYFGMYLVREDSLNFQLLSNVTPVKRNTVSNIQVFPNPSKDFLYLTSNTTMIGGRYTIYDYTGAALMSDVIYTSDNRMAIDISRLHSGMYVIQVGESSSTFIKQ